VQAPRRLDRSHTDVAAQILRRAADLGAGAIVLRPETRHMTSSVNAYIAAQAPSHVIIVNPDAGAVGRPTPKAPARLRDASHH